MTPVAPWAGCSAWRVLDGAFGQGQAFLQLWARWRADAQAPRMLHYVGLLSDDTPLAPALLDAGVSVQAGFQRFSLDAGRVSLTLCVGPLEAMLAAQSFEADQLRLPQAAWQADRWAVKAWARCCRRGSQLHWEDAPLCADLPPPWREAGFTASTPAGQWQWAPHWEVRRSRHHDIAWRAPPQTCAVIGAGLAGASVARALALRGWQVMVLDTAAQPAAGASGLPVGLVVAQLARDDSPRARLSRAGMALTLAQAHSLLERGQDWAPSGVTEMRLDAASGQRQALWHAQGAWIKPAALVAAWLKTPGVLYRGEATVTQLHPRDHGWDLLDNQGQMLAQAELVVLANAWGCKSLLQAWSATPTATLSRRLEALHPVHGSLSLGPVDAALAEKLPATPLNGLGSLVPRVPNSRGDWFWAAGASFDLQADAPDRLARHHRENLQRLQALHPAGAQALASQFASGQVRGWSGVRCVTQDRLPWVGPVLEAPGPAVWVCAGMGARGLSFSVLCAELLAARLGAEPLPLEAGLLRSLDLNRPLKHH